MKLKEPVILFTLIATTLALPIPSSDRTSVSQHLGKAGLFILTLGGLLSLAAGTITYGTHWLHRYKSLQAMQRGNMTLWQQEQEHRDIEHGKRMEGLDIILDVVRNYTDNLGKKEQAGFDPMTLASEVERGVEEAQISANGTNLDNAGGKDMSARKLMETSNARDRSLE